MFKILVIDDDVSILSVIDKLLSMKGFSVDILSVPENVQSRIESFQPNLILLDVLISGNDGRLLCRQLKADENTKRIPVIMCSGHPAAASTIGEYGADDYVAKPFDINVLIDKINHHLGILN